MPGSSLVPSARTGFRSHDALPGDLGAAQVSRLVAASSDVALVVGSDGVVRDMSVGDGDLAARLDRAWVGQPLVDTVTVECRAKVRAMLSAAAGDGLKWHEVNHPLGDDALPVRYVAVRLPKDGTVVVLGRDLRGVARLQQQLVDLNMTVERDYALYRSAEAHFRTMFRTSAEPMLIADAASRRVTDVNPAAEDVLRRVSRRLVGARLEELFAAADGDAVADCAAATRALGHASAPGLALRLGRASVSVSAWLLRGGGASQLLLRLTPDGAGPGAEPALGERWGALSHLPEAMVTATGELEIIEANDAFLDLVDAATVGQVRAESLARFVGRHGVDVDVLASRLRDGGPVRRYSTVLRGRYGAERDVELSAAAADRDEGRVYAFLFRPLAAEPPGAGEPRRPLRPVSEMTDLVGRVPLRDIVREATDIIEEMCIEAALAVTEDNRASAAEMLGLSRQSLYAKLRRYGLGDLPGEPGGGPPAADGGVKSD